MTTLLPRPAPPNPFSLHLPSLQIAWDSTSLTLLQECPRKYYYVMLKNWAAPGLAIDLDFGIAFHEALEAYQHNRYSGADHDEAVLSGTRTCLSWDDSPYVDDKKYALKNRHTLARTFVWHSEQYKDDSFKVITTTNIDGKTVPAVELSFRLPLGIEAPGGDEFWLCGHLDSVGIFQGDLYFMDHKTTRYSLDQKYFSQFNPNTQMTNYFAATQVIFEQPAKGGILNAAQLLVNGTRFARQMISRTPDQMLEWGRALQWWLRQAQRFAEEEYYPMNTNSCGNYGGCAFRPICSKDPSVREAFLSGDYEKRVWNPLETRGV